MVDRVALLARSEGRLREVGSEIAGSPWIPCDLTDPEAIAETVFHIAHQERPAWSCNVELRPFAEPWWRNRNGVSRP